MGVCVAAETEAGRPSQAKDNAVCVSGLCVCVWTAVCVWGGVCMWCVGRDTGIVSHSQAKDSTVCARARVCVCVRAHAYVRGVGRVSVCWWGGGGVRRCVACL